MRNSMRTILPVVLITTLAAPAAALEQHSINYWRNNGVYAVPSLWGMVPGLVTVDMDYTRAEHNVTELTCYPQGTPWANWLANLHDANADDPHEGVLQWGDLTPYPALGTGEIAWTGCAGSCRIPIPRLAWNEAFVLAGFSFAYPNNGFGPVDKRVAEIMIRPRPYSGFVDVTFDDGSHHPFDVWLAYVRIPVDAVASFDSMTGQVPVRGSVTTTRTPGPAVLQGFSMSFDDHNSRPLHRVSVDLSNPQLLRMRWSDLGGDDLFNWSASWLRLVY